MRILGIDFGTRKIGLAIASTDVNIASPLAVIKNDEHLLENLRQLVNDETIDEIVVGKPQGTGFEISDYLKVIEEFTLKLEEEFAIPVNNFDESFTTAEAQRLIRESNGKGSDDDVAAMVMLQAYVDTLKQK